MIINDDLRTVLETADDFDVLCEVYSQDAAPPFDPEDAELRLSSVAGITFGGETYQKLVANYNRAKRSISNEVNNCQVEFSNEGNFISNYEMTEGFDGKILVLRLVSRSQSTTLDRSLILFVGRCERPQTANKKSLTVQAVQVVGSIDVEMPRRQFKVDDPEGRHSSDVLFEGFRYTPQYGTVEYSLRHRTGFFGGKRTAFFGFSSYSDIDQSRWLPLVLGRAQMMGMNLGYIDVGRFIRTTTAFCEGPIQDFLHIRTDDQRFQFYNDTTVTMMNGYQKRYGYAGNTGPTGREQVPQSYAQFVANGYYSKTALLFTVVSGTDTLEDDPAPNFIAVVMGTLMPLPDIGTKQWTVTDTWSDNPAAHTRYLLTHPDYFGLDSAWLDDDSFTDAFIYNDGIIYDTSNGEIIQVPDSASFDGGTSALGKYLSSTSRAGFAYWRYLNGDIPLTEAFSRTPNALEYPTSGLFDGPEEPTEPPTEGRTSSLDFNLRRRYTSNVVVTENIKVTDFLHDVVFAASRMYFSQDEQGRLKLMHKKPVDNARATAAVSGTTAAVDDISPWLENFEGLALVDPNTTNSEIATVTGAAYSTATPTLSVGENLTYTGFTGGNGANNPQVATITASGFGLDDVYSSYTLDGVEVQFSASPVDYDDVVALWITASINGHPELSRRFRAKLADTLTTVEIRLLAGTLTFEESLTETHLAPLADPSAAPVGTAASGGSLEAGTVQLAYTFVNDRGETLTSPRAAVSVTAGQKITVTAVTPPTGATAVRWYCSTLASGWSLRFVKQNDGSSFDITVLPGRNAPVPPISNFTGCEVIRVAAAFTDRALARAQAERSNVLKGTFKWRLGNRKQSKNLVEITFRDPTQDFRLVTLNLKNEAAIERIKKTNKLQVNGAAIDSYNQAYRIASGLLTENLDADFFYSWSSDREALLLEEGDVVAVTDAGSGVVNLPIRVEDVEYQLKDGFVSANFTGRKYSTNLYDDSVAERLIPVVVENAYGVEYV